MKKFLLFFITFTVTLGLFTADFAMAAGGSGDIFTDLAGKASNLGSGLQQVGFIIAGFGLIVFSFMAIFNKISWKHLAYIMLSCFVLTAMVAIIGEISDNKGADVSFGGSDNASGASGTGTGGTISRTTVKP